MHDTQIYYPTRVGMYENPNETYAQNIFLSAYCGQA